MQLLSTAVLAKENITACQEATGSIWEVGLTKKCSQNTVLLCQYHLPNQGVTTAKVIKPVGVLLLQNSFRN